MFRSAGALARRHHRARGWIEPRNYWRVRQESPPILVQDDCAAADFPGAQPAGCDRIVNRRAANRATGSKLAN
jgi:hypothetical protein